MKSLKTALKFAYIIGVFVFIGVIGSQYDDNNVGPVQFMLLCVFFMMYVISSVLVFDNEEFEK